jgi:hypothetical protein
MRKFLLAALLALASLTSFADTLVANAPNGDRIEIYTDKACSPKIQELLNGLRVPPGLVFHLASAKVGGTVYEACVAQVGDNMAIIYEDGDTGMVPVEVFQKLKEV